MVREKETLVQIGKEHWSGSSRAEFTQWQKNVVLESDK